MATPQELQKQLGLGLAVKQTQQQAWNDNYSFKFDVPWQTQQGIAFSMPVHKESNIWTWWTEWISTPSAQPINYYSGATNFSAPASVSAPTSTSNMWIWDTFSGITPKKNKNIAQSTSQVGTIATVIPPIDTTGLSENQQQRLQNIAKRTAMRFPTTETQIAPVEPNKSGLTGAELEAYNMLSDVEKKQVDALATQGIKAQTDYLQKAKANMEYEKSKEKLFQDTEATRVQAEDIQSRQRLEQAAKQVANLKQNIGYLGSQWQPWVSAAKLDAVSNQVALAQKTYEDIAKIDQLNKANRSLGQESHSLQFTRQLQLLQDDLDSKVNKSIQGALNQFNAAELKGKLDTIPEIEAFQQQLYAQLDGDLSSIMDTNIEARKFLIERYDALATEQKNAIAAEEKAKAEFEKNANTLNKDMSNALGYFVNNNGEPLVDQTTGQRIVVPPETTTNYDASTGQMILITKNRDWTVGVQVKQVGAGKPEDAPKTITVENPDGTKSTMQWTGSQWSPIQANWGYIDVPRTGNNVWQDTNNPWNIMGDTEWQRDIASRLWAVGFYKSPNGRTYAVFPDMQTGVNASISDLQSKLSWWSSWVTPNTTLAQFATGWVSWPNAPMNQAAVNNYISLTGATADTKIKDIPLETLAKAVFANEGVDISKSANIPSVGTQNTDQRAEAMALVQWLGGTEWERATFAKNIMDRANKKWISLIEAKKELGYKTLDDKNFEETRKQQYTDMRKWYSESTSNAKTALTLLNEPQTAIWDVASVVWFLKTIDPASVARESEVASVENARGIIDWLSNVFAKAKEGTKLTPTQRDQLKSAIQTIVTAQDNKFLETVYDMKKEFDTRWLDPSVYIPKTYIDKAQKQFGRAEEAKKKLGGFSLTDILSNLK